MLSRLFGIYISLGVLTALYQSFWGHLRYESMGYIAGSSLVWPAVWFPGLGEIIGGIIFIALFIIFFIGRKS